MIDDCGLKIEKNEELMIDDLRLEIEDLMKEADELVAIFSTSIKSAKSKIYNLKSTMVKDG